MRRLSPLPPEVAELPVDTNFVHLVEQGFYFCTPCKRVTNLVAAEGDLFKCRCQFCAGKNVKWNPPALPA